MFSFLTGDIFKMIGVGVICAFLFGTGAYFYGKKVSRDEIPASAAKEALERIQNLEKNNETFRNLSDRDRCLVFMRDSRLPESSCD